MHKLYTRCLCVCSNVDKPCFEYLQNGLMYMCVCVFVWNVHKISRFMSFFSFYSPHWFFTLFTAFVAPPLVHRTHIVYDCKRWKKARQNHTTNALKRDITMYTSVLHVSSYTQRESKRTTKHRCCGETRLITNRRKKKKRNRKKTTSKTKSNEHDSKHNVKKC